MRNNDDRDNTGRTLALAGGGALALWFLLRGFGLGGGGGGGSGAGTKAHAAPGHAAVPCNVRIEVEGLKVDGERVNINGMVARCRAAGAASVMATGAALVGDIRAAVRALQLAGVMLALTPLVRSVIDGQVTEAGASILTSPTATGS